MHGISVHQYHYPLRQSWRGLQEILKLSLLCPTGYSVALASILLYILMNIYKCKWIHYSALSNQTYWYNTSNSNRPTTWSCVLQVSSQEVGSLYHGSRHANLPPEHLLNTDRMLSFMFPCTTNMVAIADQYFSVYHMGWTDL